MNRLMGIVNDKEISQVDCATDEEVNKFEEGITTAPELSPMRPYLNSTRHTSWNDTLCEMFVEDFKNEQEIELTPNIKATIETMFLDRLSRLVRIDRIGSEFVSDFKFLFIPDVGDCN